MGINMNILLKTNNLCKSYTNSKNVKLNILKNINIEIEKNKIAIIIGASGAGKSTLLHLLGGLDKPDSGDIIFDDQIITKMNDDELCAFRNKNIGFVFQFHHLLPEFSAIENIAIANMISGNSYNKSINKAKDLLNLVGLSERATHKPAELSGGEQQRIAIARALINEPKIILADEPTGNLDSVNSENIHSLFVELKEKLDTTMLIVSHNKELINLADTLIEMKDGIIL